MSTKDSSKSKNRKSQVRISSETSPREVQLSSPANNMNNLITNNFLNNFVKDQGQVERVNFLNKQF